MTRPVLVLVHAPHEGPGLLARALDGLPYGVRTVLDVAEPRLPALGDVSGVVVLGGSMDADDVRGHPGLAAEQRLLADAVAADVPVLAVCLGMQLLALALGARLHRRHGREIGFAPVDVVAADPVTDPLGAAPTVLHWHDDAVDLPAGATLLASTALTPVQAFRAGSAVGLQFHAEVDPAQLRLWLTVPDMVGGLEDDDVAGIRTAGEAVLPGLLPRALAGFGAFADAVRARG